MQRMLATLATLLLLTVATPFAAAQEDEPPADESHQAWVDDCPPDMMCAFGGAEDANETPESYGDEGCIECSGPVEDDASNETPEHDGRLGPDDCIDCMTPPAGNGETCMDGADAGEDCDDVQYMTPPEDGDDGAETDPISAPADDEPTGVADEEAKAVPAVGAAFMAVALLGVAAFFARRD